MAKQKRKGGDAQTTTTNTDAVAQAAAATTTTEVGKPTEVTAPATPAPVEGKKPEAPKGADRPWVCNYTPVEKVPGLNAYRVEHDGVYPGIFYEMGEWPRLVFGDEDSGGKVNFLPVSKIRKDLRPGANNAHSQPFFGELAGKPIIAKMTVVDHPSKGVGGKVVVGKYADDLALYFYVRTMPPSGLPYKDGIYMGIRPEAGNPWRYQSGNAVVKWTGKKPVLAYFELWRLEVGHAVRVVFADGGEKVLRVHNGLQYTFKSPAEDAADEKAKAVAQAAAAPKAEAPAAQPAEPKQVKGPKGPKTDETGMKPVEGGLAGLADAMAAKNGGGGGEAAHAVVAPAEDNGEKPVQAAS